MRSQNALSLALSVASVFARTRHDSRSSSDCSDISDYTFDKKHYQLDERKNLDFVTPFVNGNLPIAHFSRTRAHKFTELTYRTIKSLVLPRIDFSHPIVFGAKAVEKTHKNYEIGFEVYSLLLHVINTINPIAFDVYYNAFYSGRYNECFLILQRLYTVDSELERLITANILFLNRKVRREVVNCVHFVDTYHKDVFAIDLPTLKCEKRIPLYLPKQVLKFEEIVLFSCELDEAIMNDLEYFCPLGLRAIYCTLVKAYYRNFERMTPEQRILGFLRVKFFVFNSVGLTISFLSSGVKQNILDLLVRTAKAENEVFFRAYAVALGLLTK